MISRRGFLRMSAGGILGTILSACGFKPEPEPGSAPTGTPLPAANTPLTPTITVTPKPDPTATSESLPEPDPAITPEPSVPSHFPGVNLSSDYLVEQGRMIEETGLKELYEPVPVSLVTEPDEEPESDGIKYAELAFARDRSFPASDAPLDALIIAVAQGQRLGTIGGITYFTEGSGNQDLAFQGLSIYRDVVQIDSQDGYVIPDALPRDLVIRNGSGISVVGKDNSGQIIIAFDEPFSRNGSEEAGHFHKQMRFASLPIAAFQKLVEHFETNISFDDATWALSSNSTSEGVVQYQGSAIERVVLNPISDDLLPYILADAGFAWVDNFLVEDDEKNIVKRLHPLPSVHFLPPELISDGFTLNNLQPVVHKSHFHVGNIRQATVQALEENSGQLVAIAEFRDTNNEWTWRAPNLKNIGQLLGIYISTTTSGDEPYSNGDYQYAAQNLFGAMTDAGSLAWSNMEQWGLDWAQGLYQRTRSADQALQLQAAFYAFQAGDFSEFPPELKTSAPEVVLDHVEERINYILEKFVKQSKKGEHPTFITMLNELLWEDSVTGEVGYHTISNNPFRKIVPLVQGKYSTPVTNIISAMYLMFLEVAEKKGFEIGRDFRLAVGEYDIHSPCGKLNYFAQEMMKARQEAADALGVNIDQVRIGTALQLRDFAGGRPQYHNRLQPTREGLSQATDVLKTASSEVQFVEVAIVDPPDEQYITDKLIEIFDVAIEKGVSLLQLWFGFKSMAKDDSPDKQGYSPTGLFEDRFQPSERYNQLADKMVHTARNRSLIGSV